MRSCYYRKNVILISAVTAFLLASTALVTPASALKPTDKHPLEIVPANEVEPSKRQGNQRVRVFDGVPLTIRNINFPVSDASSAAASPEKMAKQYLRNNAKELRLNSEGLDDLELHSVRSVAAGRTVRFNQVNADGIPVYRSTVAVTMGPTNDDVVKYFSGSYRHRSTRASSGLPFGDGDGRKLGDGTWCSNEAREQALEYIGVVGEIAHESSRLVVYPHFAGGAPDRLACEIHVVPAMEPSGDWEVLVDARTGKIFRAENLAHHADGNGNVFDPDPLSSAGAKYGDSGFTDGGDADTTELSGELKNVTLKDLTFDGTNYNLVGPYAAIVDSESPKKGLFAQASSTFSYNREQDGFEAVNTYYHIDTMMRHLNIHLGLDITPYQYSGGARFDPHGLNGSDNSHYSSSSGEVAFGEGGVDDAEDADVIIHELGHALHDWVTGGWLSQNEGLSEGSGDYIAQSYRRSLSNNKFTPVDLAYHWVFNWDGHNSFWGGRTTNYDASYPDGLIGSIHRDGQIWSTCNMKIWDLIGRDLTDKAFWSGLGMTSSSTNQEDAAQAILDAAVNLGYTSSVVSDMESIYQGCGYNVVVMCTATCGNGIVECGEVCDGIGLGGETCSSSGCTGGGSLACKLTCDGFDTSSCYDCPQCNHDGICDAGEDCNGCSDDCIGGTTSGAECGNGICEAGNGEDCVSCPADCNGVQGGKPSNRFCCGDGGGQGPLSCSDSACSTGGWTCTDISGSPGTYCCGDGACEGGESSSNCAIDCGLPAVCGDGNIDDGEVCDGNALGGETCAGLGCEGTLACESNCLAFDTSGCSNCPTCAANNSPCSVDSDCCSLLYCHNNGKCRGGRLLLGEEQDEYSLYSDYVGKDYIHDPKTSESLHEMLRGASGHRKNDKKFNSE